MGAGDGKNGDKGKDKSLPTLPVQPRDPSSSAAPEDPTPQALGAPEQLGFDLRFEAGRTLLALKDKTVEPGVGVARALFEVPDVDYPLNVSGGPQQFRNRRLTLRAIELTLSHASLYVSDKLKAAGFVLARERARAGGIELLVEMQGPAGPVPIRARGIFAPVGEAGVALVLHEVISFSPLPRPRAAIAQSLLDALHLPGALPARAMVRRADPFRAVLGRLLPQYGWKVPAVGDVRVHEVVLGKGEVTLRAWARELPEGWKAPRNQKRGPLEEAVALAVFADGLVGADSDEARIALVDKLNDEGALSPSVVPFAAEVLRTDPRRRAEGDDLLDAALQKAPEHLGLLAAHAEQEGKEPAERAHRLQALGKAADLADEPWVAARAFLVAASIAKNAGDDALALSCAEAAFLADPSVPETGTLTARLLAEAGEFARALATGRTALERAEDPAAADAFAVELAALAKRVEGIDSARVLLRRALRRADRKDALVALIDVEVEAGALERAAELLTRLLVVVEDDSAARADVEILAARLAEARGDREAARMHLANARELRPADPIVAVRLAGLMEDTPERALDVLREAVDAEDAPAEPLVFAARLLVKRAGAGDAERARALIARVPPVDATAAVKRIDAEAQALLGAPGPLAELLLAEADTDTAGGSTPPSLSPSAKRIEAARLFVAAGRVDDAADALVRAFPQDAQAVAAALAAAPDAPNAAGLVSAVGARAADVPVEQLHAVAQKLAGAGRPRDAHALLAARDDKQSLELRASFADAAGETALEIEERERLLPLLEDDPQKAALALRRLGALHMRDGGRGPGAAADALQEAADKGSVDVGAWLEAALASQDGSRLAAVLRRDDAEVHNVPSGPLRAAVAALTDDPTARLRLAGVLAARGEQLEDVEMYLSEARALPPSQAADVLADAGVRHGRGAWLLEAAGILEAAGDAPGALKRLLDATGAAAADGAVAHKAFSLAVAVQDAGAIDTAARALLGRHDVDAAARVAVHAQRARALLAIDSGRGRTALGLWLDEDPRSDSALSSLIPELLGRGELAYALDRLEKACRAEGDGAADGSAAEGDAARATGAALAALLDKLAGAAQKKGDVAVEIRARELALGTGAGQARAVELERLADLYGEAGRTQNAVDVLGARIELGGTDEQLAGLYSRIASLEEDQLKNKPAAADAWRGHLRHAPDDAQASRHLQALLGELGDDGGLLDECLRRGDRLKPGAERTDLWLRAGDAALRLDRHRDARDIWLRALKSAPYSGDALDRLLDLARVTKNHRLVVRARLAAAQTLADGPLAAEQAAEAGAYLYGFVGRTRLALAAFRFAETHDKKPQKHTRVRVDLHRALGDGPSALDAVDQLLERARITEKALLLETRAEILDELLHDAAGAAEARRQCLEVDPTLRTAARSLSRWLRDGGDLRGALDVDRAWADAALEGAARASAYALLAARADEEVHDPALAADLCAQSLALADSTDVLRRYAGALADSGADTAAVDALGKLLARSIPVEERIALLRRKAVLESGPLGQKKEARRTLEAALEDADVMAHEDADGLVDDLVGLDEELDDPGAAASLLLSALQRSPDGTRALGDRKAVIERAAQLLDDAKDRTRALELLEEIAAGSRELSRPAEMRRARIAEELSRFDVAVASLERLLPLAAEAEERVALLGRLALAAEKCGRADTALGAWQGRAERLPGDVESLRAVERLARDLSRPAEARAAADALLLLDAGDDDERFARLLSCARDSRDRLGDAGAAVKLLDKARAIRTDAELRKETLACAEAAGDTDTALALLDEMGSRNDSLDAADLVRRAELRFGAGEDTSAALEDVLAALDAGATPDERVRSLVARAATAEPTLAAQALLGRAHALPSTGAEPGPFSLGTPASASALRDAFTAESLRDGRLEDGVLVALADACPGDVDVVLAAAEREASAGQGLRAADRMWALAERVDDEGRRAVLRQTAAEALLSGPGADSAVLGRLHELRPSLVDRADLRGQALVLLRDAEAWDAVALVLEDAIAAADAEAGRPEAGDGAGDKRAALRRALRLELVSVLRTGLDDEARAVTHLQALVDEDPDDREAWGELLECLDALGDKPRLAEALGRRAERSAGIEKREIVRRRAALLLEMHRGEEALDQLVEVRAELQAGGGADGELKVLERRIHEERGSAALGAFLAAEMARAPDPLDAEALLAIEPDAVDPAARVHAHLVLATDEDRARHRARAIFDAAMSPERRIAEAVAVATASSLAGATAAGAPARIDLSTEAPAAVDVGAPAGVELGGGDGGGGVELGGGGGAPPSGGPSSAALAALALDDGRRAAFLLGLAAGAGALGSAGALELSDALFAAGVDAADAFGVAAARRRWRIAGPRRAAGDVERLVASARNDDDRRRAALVAFRRAVRISDADAAVAAARDAALSGEAAEALAQAVDDRTGVAARALLEEHARRAVRRQAQTSAAVVAAVRVGDAARGTARLDQLTRQNGVRADDVARAARRASHLRLTPERLALRLALSASLPEDARQTELHAAAAVALRAERWREAAFALDGTIDARTAGGAVVDAETLSSRAEVAWHLGAFDAAEWSTRAADALPVGPEALKHRKKAVEGLLRSSTSQLSEVGLDRALLAFARCAPDDEGVQAEALGIAQASGLHDVIDELMAEAAERSAGSEARSEVVRRRAEHRMTALKDAQGAFSILLGGAAGGDRSLREAAYRLAAAEGLVEAQVDVVDDELAKAGLLALLGKSDAAVALARELDTPAAWLLVTEVAALEGDTDTEAAALEKLGASGAADAATLGLLVGLDRRRGRLDDAARRAADLVERFGASPERVALLLDVAGGGAGAERAAPILKDIVEAGAEPPGLAGRILDVWEAAARAAGLPEDARAARLRRCRKKDDDGLWLELLVAEMPGTGADEAALWLRPLLLRRGLFQKLVEAGPRGLAEAVGVLVMSGDAALVVDALGALDDAGGSTPPVDAASPPEPLAWPLRSELASALAVLGRPADAARVLLRGVVDEGSRGRRATRAAQLFLDAGDVPGAVEALLAAPLAEADDELVSLARDVATQAGGDGAPLLVRTALVTADEGDVEAALGLATQAAPDVARAVAGWRLRADPTDHRAWQLAAMHPGGAQQHFAVALALRGRGAWPADLVDDAARAHRLRDGMLPPHVARAWVEAKAGRAAEPKELGLDAPALLARARRGSADERKVAWRALAARAAIDKDDVAAARMLARAGVPMSEAPIEVRLAADPELATPSARIAAIAAAAVSDEVLGDPGRRRALVAAFDELDDKGYAGAALRQEVHGARRGLPGLIDGLDSASTGAASTGGASTGGAAADLAGALSGADASPASGSGGAVDARAVLRALGRRPSAAQRATAAALLAVSSAPGGAGGARGALARLLDPRMFATVREEPGAADLEARARAHADAHRFAEAAGLLRLVAALAGYDAARERDIQELAEKGGRVDLVVESLGRMAGAAPDAVERAGLLRERALVRAGQKEMLQAASKDARGAFAIVPDDVDSARLWLQLAEMAGDDRDVADALGAVAATTEKPAEKSESVARRVRLLVESLKDNDAALVAVDESLAVLPGDAALLEERARVLAALAAAAAGRAAERAAGDDDRGDDGDVRELFASAARAFDDAAREREPAARGPLRRSGADAWLGAGDAEEAVATLCTAAAEGDAEALGVAEPLARERCGPGSLAKVLELLLGVVEEPQRRRVLTLERARLLAESLADRHSAIALLEAQAVADAHDVGARLALAEWYLEGRRVLDAALAYESAAKIPGLPPMAVGPAAREAACLLASLGDLERAGPLAETAIADGVIDHRVLAVAAAWHRAHGRFADVDQLLGREIDLEPDPFAQATMWMERADLRREKLEDDVGARKAIHRVLELVPDHEGALDAMRVDAEREGTWGPLRAALFRAADFAGKKDFQKARMREIAVLDADRFQDLKAAEATVDRALEIDPDDADTLVLKARLLVRGGHVDGVPALIERAEQGGARELPGILQLVRGDGLLISGDRDGAREAFIKASRDPETSAKAWDRLIDLADGTPHFALTLEEARLASDDKKRQATLLKKEARARQKGGDDDGQVACLEQLLALEPGDTDSLRVVRDVYTRKRKLQPLLPLLSAWARSLDREHFGSERARRLGELGTFVLDELGNEQLARETFEEALSVDPDENTALLRLADIAWAARDDERALEILDRIQPAQWPRDPVDLVYRRARCAYALGRDDAQERLRAVLRLDAKHQDALEMLVKLALQKKDDDAAELALEALTSAIPAREDPVRAAQAYVELANLRGRLSRWNEAVVAAERAFELDPANVQVLEVVAVARDESGKHLEAAEVWRRLASTRVGAARMKALESRAQSLHNGGRVADAVEVLIELRRETGEQRFREQAEAWAQQSGDRAVMKKVGLKPPPPPPGVAATASDPPEITSTQTMTSDSDRAAKHGFNALHLQVRANLSENDPKTALDLVEQAVAQGAADLELLQLGVEAAEKGNQPQRLVDLVDNRLKSATDPVEIKQLARAAAQVAKERLVDLDRAAGLLYQAHQADAEDVEVRLDLTRMYAQIPRLASHAVTGILQLLRRTPSDARVFALAADLAESQQQGERARAMRAVESILRGKGVPQEINKNLLDERPQLSPLDAESIQARMAPTGWNGPMQQLLAVLGAAAETVFGDAAPPADAVPLHEKSPRGALALDRLERILAGRPFRVLVGNVDRLTVVPGAAPAVVLPLDLLSLGDTALLAGVARAYGIVRLGAVLPEILKPGDDVALVNIIRNAFGNAPDAHGQRMLSRLREDELRVARGLAHQAVANSADIAGTMSILQRAADRFALVVSGSVVATLHAGALPSLMREPPQRAASILQGSSRGLELAAFAARDNAWLLRRQHGLSS